MKKKIQKTEFADYSKKEFKYTDEKSYYDSFWIYYKSYDYEGKEFIKDYYFTGKKNDAEETIIHAYFEIQNNEIVCVVKNKNNEIVIDVPCAGDLYFMDKALFKEHDVTFLGFTDFIFQKPIRQELAYIASDSEVPVKHLIWPIVYDYENNIVKQFSPE